VINVIVRITVSLSVNRDRNAVSKKKYRKSLLLEFLENLATRNERYSKKPVKSSETQMYAKDMIRIMIKYGSTPALPTIPLVMVPRLIEKVANKTIRPMMGANP
jgi:hypothetical protein